jgi:hypothetical protein
VGLRRILTCGGWRTTARDKVNLGILTDCLNELGFGPFLHGSQPFGVGKAAWDTHDLLFAERIDEAVSNTEACRVTTRHGEGHIQMRDPAFGALEEALALETGDNVFVETNGSALLLGTGLVAIAITIAILWDGIGTWLLSRVTSRAEILPDKGRLTEWVGRLADGHFNVLDNFLGMDASLLKHQWRNGLIVVEHGDVRRT